MPRLEEEEIEIEEDYKRKEPATSLEDLYPGILNNLKIGGEASLKQMIESVEKSVLKRALEQTDGNVRKAANLLHIARSWMYKQIRKYDLQKNEE